MIGPGAALDVAREGLLAAVEQTTKGDIIERQTGLDRAVKWAHVYSALLGVQFEGDLH